MVSQTVLVLVSASLIIGCHAANILGVATYDGNSHWLVMKSVFKTLENAGHSLTVITPYASSAKDNNFTVIDVSKVLPLRTNAFEYDFVIRDYHNPLRTLSILPQLSNIQCDKSHAMPEIRRLLRSARKFDLVVAETFGADCDAVFAHLLQVPLITVITSIHLPWANSRVGNPENPSYVGTILTDLSDRMTFGQRVKNVFYYLSTVIMMTYQNFVTTQINRKHFGQEIPAVDEILSQRTSLIFVNSHFTVDAPRPFVPNIIEIGGIHLPPVKPLPKDLAKFMDESTNGVIYFSLGSILRAATMPNETINAIKQAFAELGYNVLWKFEDETLDVSKNVAIRKWFPQRDILAHKNLKLAIMHGGLMGIYEAVDCGIPILGIPVFFDQHKNIENLVSKGVALRLDIDKITKANFLDSIRRLLDDKSFKQRAQKLSKRFQDRIVKPSDAVVYWTDYVLKHEGAYHMRSAATEMYWFQVLLLDVIVFILFVLFVVIYAIRKTIAFLRRRCRSTSSKRSSNINRTVQNGSVHLKSN